MANWKLQALRGKQRRDFLKLILATGAGLGIERSGILNYIAGVAGHGIAEAAVSNTNRAVLLSCGQGVYAWLQELWPMPEIPLKIAEFPKTSWLYHNGVGYSGAPGHYIGAAAAATTGDRHFYYGPDAPWLQDNSKPPSASNLPKRYVTGIMAGTDETHTPFPNSATLVGAGSDLPAMVGALQTKNGNSAIVPAIGLDPLDFGAADGAPNVVSVPNAQGFIDTFNSAASQLTLSATEDRQIFETYYNALLGLRRAAPRSSWQPELVITKNAAHLVGLNLSAGLVPTAQDLEQFGIIELLDEPMLSAAQRSGLESFGRSMIVVARALANGLTNMAVVALSQGSAAETSFTDPHVTFASPDNLEQGRNTTKYLGKILNGFYDLLDQVEEPGASSETVGDNTVFAAWGDTPHTPLQGSGWSDTTPLACNWLYAMDPKQNIVSGWFGQVHATVNSTSAHRVSGFDPVTGVEADNTQAGYIKAIDTAPAAGAAVGYAVTKGDWNSVAEYYAGPKIEAMLKT